MKRTKKILGQFIDMMSHMLQNNKTVFYKDLPGEVKAFAQKKFQGYSIAFIEKKDSDYLLTLNDGSEITISEDGEWEEVQSREEAKLISLLPKDITDNVKEFYSNAKIIRIDKNTNGYEVALSSAIYLKYNNQGLAA